VETIDKSKIGKRIAERRAQRQLTQEQLSEKIGMTENQVSRMENGRVIPRGETAIKLSRVLNVSTDYILLGHDIQIDDEGIADIIQNVALCNKRERILISDLITSLLKNREKDI